MNAGEQVTWPTLKKFYEKLKPFGVKEENLMPSFGSLYFFLFIFHVGMAEVGTCMTYNNTFTFENSILHGRVESNQVTLTTEGPETFISLGKVTPGTEIRIVDEYNKVVEELVIGKFQIRGQSVMPGYLLNDKANQESFVGEGWFHTGDLGFIHKKELILTGREKERIVIRGNNLFCYDIEETVAIVQVIFLENSCCRVLLVDLLVVVHAQIPTYKRIVWQYVTYLTAK